MTYVVYVFCVVRSLWLRSVMVLVAARSFVALALSVRNHLMVYDFVVSPDTLYQFGIERVNDYI